MVLSHSVITYWQNYFGDVFQFFDTNEIYFLWEFLLFLYIFKILGVCILFLQNMTRVKRIKKLPYSHEYWIVQVFNFVEVHVTFFFFKFILKQLAQFKIPPKFQ